MKLHVDDLEDEDLRNPHARLSRIAGRVVLELTENESLRELADISPGAKALEDIGFTIAIDDFGMGYGGLTRLAQIQPGVVKLDRALIRDIAARPRSQSLVRAACVFCDELGSMLIAEGVETAAERDMLVSLGCEVMQGDLFGLPDRAFLAPTW